MHPVHTQRRRRQPDAPRVSGRMPRLALHGPPWHRRHVPPHAQPILLEKHAQNGPTIHIIMHDVRPRQGFTYHITNSLCDSVVFARDVARNVVGAHVTDAYVMGTPRYECLCYGRLMLWVPHAMGAHVVGASCYRCACCVSVSGGSITFRSTQHEVHRL